MLWFLTILSLKNDTKGKPKIPLDTSPILGYFPAIVTHRSFWPNNLTLYFWRIYEMGFPEGSNVKAPRDSEIPFGAFLFYPFKFPMLHKCHLKFQG
jgi:hypothetical protein